MGDRSHCVSVRVSLVELSRLDKERVTRQRGAYLRDVWLSRPLPVAVPELNRSAWQQLARTASNLNQLAHSSNLGEVPELLELRAMLGEFRAALLRTS